MREYPDGSKKVLAASVASKLPIDGSVKRYWKAGYPGTSRAPRVLLAHPTLPEMDFVDMLRGHLVELSRQLFIYNVPRDDAHRYIRLLVARLTPFLDWVYTGGKAGRKNFCPDGDRELRHLVLEIRSTYGRRAGQGRRTSEMAQQEGTPSVSIATLTEKAIGLLQSTQDPEIRKACERILDSINQEVLTENDVMRLREHIVALIQQEGNDWHRVLLSDLHHCSLIDAVLSGDSMLETVSDRQFLAEVLNERF